ncbi:MAG: biopolymer transporter ExbD [Deltaproteobacteria bacterium]|jgi:biopolymer transport protein TolR|nr:biopolymer transporter ExbD [Deltaproteobacteria bacterium]
MAGSAQADDDEPITSINIIPLVDIVLVVLIIFMVTASYIVTPAIRVELPKAATGEPMVSSTLALVLTKEGDLFLNNDKTDDEALRAYIKRELAAGKDLEAVIAADASVRHGRVVALIDLIKSEGIVKFAINTADEFSSQNNAGDAEKTEEAAPSP